MRGIKRTSTGIGVDSIHPMNSVVRRGFSEKVTFQQRLDGSNGIIPGYLETWRTAFQSEGTTNAKARAGLMFQQK